MMSITPCSSEQSMGHSPYSIIVPQDRALKATRGEYEDDRNGWQVIDEVSESREESGVSAMHRQVSLVVGGMTRTQTLQSLSASSVSSAESGCQVLATRLHESSSTFGVDLRNETCGDPDVPSFSKGTRRAMEPHLRKARLLREQSRKGTLLDKHAAIASSVGVPYARLRRERPFLFDIHTHPMHEILADTLGIADLSKIHNEGDLRCLMQPLLVRVGRRRFQEVYDSFVTSFCIPLLHSIAMSQNLFHSSGNDSGVSYRYQAFPKIQIVRPGETSTGPRCGTSNGHSVGFLHFHVPLTASMGTNALYAESHPGKEDWHPLAAKSVGLGFLFDGARCLHWNMENTTDTTSVALEFVIAICGGELNSRFVDGESLCDHATLEDEFSRAGPGYYNEAVIDAGIGSPAWQIIARKRDNQLWDPDDRIGFPFD